MLVTKLRWVGRFSVRLCCHGVPPLLLSFAPALLYAPLGLLLQASNGHVRSKAAGVVVAAAYKQAATDLGGFDEVTGWGEPSGGCTTARLKPAQSRAIGGGGIRLCMHVVLRTTPHTPPPCRLRRS